MKNETETKNVVVAQIYSKNREGYTADKNYILRFWLAGKIENDGFSRECHTAYMEVQAYVAIDSSDGKCYTHCAGFVGHKSFHLEDLYHAELPELENAVSQMKLITKIAEKLNPHSFADWLAVIKKAYKVTKLYNYSRGCYEPTENTYEIERQARELDYELKTRLMEVAADDEKFAEALNQTLMSLI